MLNDVPISQTLIGLVSLGKCSDNLYTSVVDRRVDKLIVVTPLASIFRSLSLFCSHFYFRSVATRLRLFANVIYHASFSIS